MVKKSKEQISLRILPFRQKFKVVKTHLGYYNAYVVEWAKEGSSNGERLVITNSSHTVVERYYRIMLAAQNDNIENLKKKKDSYSIKLLKWVNS